MASSIDPTHPMANRTVLKYLETDLTGLIADVNSDFLNGGLASKVAGTTTKVYKLLPAPPESSRMSAILKIDKTTGRTASFGYSNGLTGAGNTTGIVYTAAGGIDCNGKKILTAADCLDGAEFLLTITSDTTLSANGATYIQFSGVVQDLSGNIPPNHWTANMFGHSWPQDQWLRSNQGLPKSIFASTNYPSGALRNLTYADHALAIIDANDKSLVRVSPVESTTDVSQRSAILSRCIDAPLKVILTSGGSGVYGGVDNWGMTTKTYSWNAILRPIWADLADEGYTLLHPNALHEGWGANSHLQLQVNLLTRLQAAVGSFQLDYIGYSMGAFSAWRAILGRAGFPPIRKAYIVAGAIDLSIYEGSFFPQLAQRWGSDPRESPINISGADYIARGTKVRLAHLTADPNVDKATTHDVMKAKYAESPLFEERVIVGNNHFGPDYWDSADMIEFFNADSPTGGSSTQFGWGVLLN